MEEKLREYAKLLIEVGLNVQKGQAVVIRCPVECPFPIVRCHTTCIITQFMHD